MPDYSEILRYFSCLKLCLTKIADLEAVALNYQYFLWLSQGTLLSSVSYSICFLDAKQPK